MTDEITLASLSAEIVALRDEMSVLVSVQRLCADLDARLQKVERSDNDLLQQCAKSLVDVQKRLKRLEPTEIVVPKVASFGSVEALVKQVEVMFDCRDGDHRAYYTEYNEATGECSHYNYVVLGITAAGEDAPEKLRQELYTALFKLKQSCPSERPVLFWRHAVQERIQEERGVGTDLHKIRVRVAIPGADFSVIGPVLAKEGESFWRLMR